VWAGYLLANYSPLLVLGTLALSWIFRRIQETKEGRRFFDRVKLRLPILGSLLQKSCIVRFSGTMAKLLASGVPILQALDICRETGGNEVLTQAMNDVYASVKDGESIHEPLSRHSIFPPLVIHMVSVGEETGAIDQMLQKVAEAYV
jgi:type IV pilus assembly protein PilC